jgi:aspartyl-tRNA(Asn)/glutamyl-tRNA(Gln) amidotransferase subunit B
MYGLSEYDASTIIDQDGAAKYFESAAIGCTNSKRLANWLTSEVFGHLNEQKCDIGTLALTPAQLRSLADLVEVGKINGTPVMPSIIDVRSNLCILGLKGKEVLALMLAGDSRRAELIVKEKGWEQITSELEVLCSTILQKHPKEKEEFLRGKTALMGFFIGQAMRASLNRADPKSLTAVFTQLLSK